MRLAVTVGVLAAGAIAVWTLRPGADNTPAEPPARHLPPLWSRGT